MPFADYSIRIRKLEHSIQKNHYKILAKPSALHSIVVFFCCVVTKRDNATKKLRDKPHSVKEADVLDVIELIAIVSGGRLLQERAPQWLEFLLKQPSLPKTVETKPKRSMLPL